MNLNYLITFVLYAEIMAKIEFVGNGFVKIKNELINLAQYKSIIPTTLKMFESTDGDVCGIEVIPLIPSIEDIKSNVDGKYFITLYQGEGAEIEMNEDFEILTRARSQSSIV